jgi:hypothetical protein
MTAGLGRANAGRTQQAEVKIWGGGEEKGVRFSLLILKNYSTVL